MVCNSEKSDRWVRVAGCASKGDYESIDALHACDHGEYIVALRWAWSMAERERYRTVIREEDVRSSLAEFCLSVSTNAEHRHYRTNTETALDGDSFSVWELAPGTWSSLVWDVLDERWFRSFPSNDIYQAVIQWTENHRRSSAEIAKVVRNGSWQSAVSMSYGMSEEFSHRAPRIVDDSHFGSEDHRCEVHTWDSEYSNDAGPTFR